MLVKGMGHFSRMNNTDSLIKMSLKHVIRRSRVHGSRFLQALTAGAQESQNSPHLGLVSSGSPGGKFLPY